VPAGTAWRRRAGAAAAAGARGETGESGVRSIVAMDMVLGILSVWGEGPLMMRL
jgi:hypothetical protein